jgi:hypothetical protein
MGDRKTIQKYYPADFDPSLITRTRAGHTATVTKFNFACPFRSMKHISCGHYTTKGKVFRNSPKYISSDTYLGMKIVRLHCKCPDCRSEIIIETDPKNMDYRIVSGRKIRHKRGLIVSSMRKQELQVATTTKEQPWRIWRRRRKMRGQ